jgi:hypothetical protein
MINGITITDPAAAAAADLTLARPLAVSGGQWTMTHPALGTWAAPLPAGSAAAAIFQLARNPQSGFWFRAE